MQQKSLGKQIWEIFSPIVVHFVVTLVVEMIIIMIYYMKCYPELIAAMESQEALTEQILEMAYTVYDYVVEITGVASAITIPILVWMKRRDEKKEKEQGMIPNKKASLAKYVLVAGISIPFAVGLNNILTLFNLAEYSVAYQETAEALYSPSIGVQILCLCIVVPIAEEYMFRGLIYRRIRRNTTAIRAIVSSALFFGLYHGNSVQMIYGVLCGILLAYMYEKFGSMKAPVLGHMLMNTVAVVLTDVDAFTWMFTKPMRMAVITIACAAIASTMFIFIRDIQEKPEVEVTYEDLQ